MAQDTEGEPSHAPPKGIGRAALTGTIYVGLAQAAKVILTVVSTIILARLLAPSDYGVVAMVSPISGFILIFQNIGLNQAAIQAKSISSQQTNALFWINLIASVVIALVFIAGSPLVSIFYSDPRAGSMMAASALTVLITGLSMQHVALLNRNLKFKQLGIIDISASLTTLFATTVAAYVLRSYWAIWVGAVAAAVTTALMAWRYSGWRPHLRPSFGDTRQLFAFGANVTGFNLLNYIARNLDNVLIAKMWGAAAVGLYDRAYKLMLFPLTNINAPLGRVVLPVLARLQDDPAKFREAFLLILRALTLVSIPGIVAAAATSADLVPLLLGERWAGAAPIFYWLGLAAIAQPIGNATGWLFMSSGRSRQLLRWGIFSSATSVIAFVVGVRWGAVGVAQAYLFAQLLRLPLLFVYCTRGSVVGLRDLIGVQIAPALAGVATYAGILLMHGHVPRLMYLAFAFALSYALAVAMQLMSPGGRAAVRRLSGIVGGALGRRVGRHGNA